MNALRAIRRELLAIGYASEALIHDYTFADVLSAGGEERHVDLAAFTQVPESYRSAAFGVTSAGDDEATVLRQRALGAPILFSIGQRDIGVWRVGARGSPRLLERVRIDALPELFRRNAERWQPQAVHRAKSLGQSNAAYQLDFVDLALIPAIEHEVEEKLDRLLKQVIERLLKGANARQEEAAFRITFRLLAAKILLDREHPDASSWRDAPVTRVLKGIETYYSLGKLSSASVVDIPSTSIAETWAMLRGAISFRNISSDSLAFVYENTLVTADTRRRFGTHSTPRHVAEYVVERLDLGQFDLKDLTIFEPFTGAGSFLVAALRRLRDLLPDNLSDKQRHAFLVRRIQGAEIDAFACEVATLSLILADYPNANGWQIEADDLFRPAVLSQKTSAAKVVLCNPPWEDFDTAEREQYPEMVSKSFSKPMAVLRTVLDAKPEGIGFVLPQGFLRQQQFAELRQHIADLYGRVELTSLPDRVFQRAGLEAALLVASERRPAIGSGSTKLVSTVVEDRDRTAFLTTAKVTAERRRSKFVRRGDLWIGQLDELWEHLERYPKLGTMAEIFRGLQWRSQRASVSQAPKKGFKLGVFHPSDSLRQFEVLQPVYLNIDEAAAYRSAPLTRPWSKPKVLTNVARLSRGRWRIAATSDRSGLVASQGFFGIWPTQQVLPVEVLEAILNGPLSNAFLTEHASNQHFTNALVKRLPIPKVSSFDGIVDAAMRYREALAAFRSNALRASDAESSLNRLLLNVDAEVLRAYDLPPRLERRLLEFFRGHEQERRTAHLFKGWIPADFTAFIPLHEYLGPLVEHNRGPWALDVFTPAPEDEVALFERYVH